jgi:hypothetical protein
LIREDSKSIPSEGRDSEDYDPTLPCDEETEAQPACDLLTSDGRSVASEGSNACTPVISHTLENTKMSSPKNNRNGHKQLPDFGRDIQPSVIDPTIGPISDVPTQPSVLQEFSHLAELMKRGNPVHENCKECRIKDQEMRWMKARIVELESTLLTREKKDNLDETIFDLMKENQTLRESRDSLDHRLRIAERVAGKYKSLIDDESELRAFTADCDNEVPELIYRPNHTLNATDSMNSQLRYQEDIVVSVKDQIMRLGNQLKLGRQLRGLSIGN